MNARHANPSGINRIGSVTRARSRNAEQAGEHRTDPFVTWLAMKTVVPVLVDLDLRQLDRGSDDLEVEILGQHAGDRRRQYCNRIGVLGDHCSSAEGRNAADEVLWPDGRLDSSLGQFVRMPGPERRDQYVVLGGEFAQ